MEAVKHVIVLATTVEVRAGLGLGREVEVRAGPGRFGRRGMGLRQSDHSVWLRQ